MSRRSRRLITIPDDYLPHNGNGCPLTDEDRPDVITRMGTHIRGAYSCEEYGRWAEDPWTWDADHPSGSDIIAYRSEFVEIPRMSYDAPPSSPR